MFDVFSSKEAINRFARKNNPKVVERVIQAIEKVAKAIRSSLEMMGQKLDGSGKYVHPEIKALVDDYEALEGIRTRFDEAMKAASASFEADKNKKTAAEATDKSSGIKFSKKENYSSRMQNTIEGYLDAVDADFLSFIENTKKGLNQQNSKYYFGKVTDNVANAIESLLGLNVANWNVAIEAKNISHILKDHGENGITDKSMSNDNDLARIQFVFENFDSIEKSGSTNAYKERKSNGFNKNAQTVKYEKKVNGVYYVVQAVPNTKAKTLYIVTGYIADKKSIKKEALQFSESEINSASEQTSKNANASASIDSISQGSEDVNNKFSLKAESETPTAIDRYYAEAIRENRAFSQIFALMGDIYSSKMGEVYLDNADIRKTAKGILKEFGSRYDEKALADELQIVYDYMANNRGNIDVDGCMKIFMQSAQNILENSEMKDDELWRHHADLREFLREQRIYISPELKAEIESAYGDYKSFRSRLTGKMMHISTKDSSASTLNFTPSCSLELLKQQKSHMGQYLYCLEVRAQIEGIEL